MIRSFKDERTKDIIEGRRVKGIGAEVQKKARRKLNMLDAAVERRDVLVPSGNRLEKLVGDREGQWSVRVNDKWRICFVWREHDAYEVELDDYH